MSVECKDDVTIIVEGDKDSHSEVLIWTIGAEGINRHIDAALGKTYPEQYARFGDKGVVTLQIG